MERLILDLLGLLLIAAGFVLLPTPLPFGILLIALGAFLLALEEEGVRTFIRTQRARHPRFNSALSALERSLPKPMAEVVQKTRP